MIHIFTALKPEAQAFVDKYRLNKQKIDNYTTYSNEKMILIITGVGVANTKKACEFAIQKYKPTQNDIFINIGICGSKKDNPIGTLLKIGKLSYKTDDFLVDENSQNRLTCIDYEATKETYDLVDMESYGFYDALYEKYNNLHIFKVVSDHFEPKTVTKEKTKSLIFNTIEDVFTAL